MTTALRTTSTPPRGAIHSNVRLTQAARSPGRGRAATPALTEKIVPRGAHWGARLKHLRMSIGVDQQELAAAAGIRQMTLSHLERGETRPHDATVAAISAAIGIGSDALRDFCERSIPLDPVRSAPATRRRLQYRMLDDSLSPWLREGDLIEVDGGTQMTSPVMPELAVVHVERGDDVIPVAGLAMPVGGRVRLRRGTDADPILVTARSILPVVSWTRGPAR